MPNLQLTPCEAEVMDVVWEREQATVQDVVDALQRPLAYTTVMTTLRILEDKEIVCRHEKRGRAFVYRPRVSRDQVQTGMTRDLANRMFRGSIKSMLLNLVQTEPITPLELDEIRAAMRDLEART